MAISNGIEPPARRRRAIAPTLEELPLEEARALLKKHKHPLGARCARGRKYLTPEDAARAGAAIEKRARRALKRRRPTCDCRFHPHQVCDVCQGVTGQERDR